MPTPTVVLVHGAFADTALWFGVVAELHSHGIPVLAPPNPLRGLASDAAHIASVAARIDGPVVLVGHAYGGAVITVAGTADNVVGLVYVAAYVPEVGESLSELQGRFPATELVGNLRRWTYRDPAGGEVVEVGLTEDAYPAVFAADVSAPVARVLACCQHPLAEAAFEEKATAAAWRARPSWALVAGADRTIAPDVERFGAARAGACVVEIDGASHAVALSQPTAVARLIRDAVHAVG
ncbi:alpha/beta fold hydrolase [Streptomyces cinerochromogenes]|uniref:alpha/beta fold hydrolase n=1 Tax=Streptomyces cinerochromogenes TaxID=66422 RepID=UPI0016710FAA|nr:alpha/beta hydrolase [Streptomyces cinerochromogenes]GGS76949.1 alpha/beta hydrolase [Streptomyces cinerochromogenes]